MWIGHPIPELRLFQNLSLKIKGQGHEWGHTSKLKLGSNILSTDIRFTPCQSALPFLRYRIFKIWPWNQGSSSKDHDVAQLQVQTIPWNFEWYKSIQWFQRYGFRKVWLKCCLIWLVFGPWASPYGQNGQITMTGHNYRSGQVHETLNGVNPSSRSRDLRSAKSGPNLCQIWQVFGPWASPYGTNGQMTMTMHNRRPRQFHRTSNWKNLSSCYRDMGSASLAAARPTAGPDRDDNAPPARRSEGYKVWLWNCLCPSGRPIIQQPLGRFTPIKVHCNCLSR